MKKIHHIAELIRIGNMPSLFTHCILGLAIVSANPKNSIRLDDINVLLLALKTLAGILLMYGGGNAMNDVLDIKKDHSKISLTI